MQPDRSHRLISVTFRPFPLNFAPESSYGHDFGLCPKRAQLTEPASSRSASEPYAPAPPPAYFGTTSRLSPDPMDDQVKAAGLVDEDHPESAPSSVVYDKRRTIVIDERETLKLN